MTGEFPQRAIDAICKAVGASKFDCSFDEARSCNELGHSNPCELCEAALLVVLKNDERPLSMLERIMATDSVAMRPPDEVRQVHCWAHEERQRTNLEENRERVFYLNGVIAVLQWLGGMRDDLPISDGNELRES